VSSAVLRALLVVSCGSALGCADLRPDLMLVEHVVFEGADRATVASLRHLSDLHNGDRTWEVDVEAVARAVERHPWVAQASAEVVAPATVVVRVVEHEPIALLSQPPAREGDPAAGLYYVDATGLPFMRAHPSDLDYPVITGIGPELARSHPSLPRLAGQEALRLLDEINGRRLVAPGAVSEIVVDAQRGFSVRLVGGARVEFAFVDIERQVDRLEALVTREGVRLDRPILVDVAPAGVAIVRPLDLGGAPGAGASFSSG
jgi:hypothetical protein